MHGELLEFNENLQRTVQVWRVNSSPQLINESMLVNSTFQTKEAALIRLREELVRVRGPLPEDGEDTASLSSQDNARSLSFNLAALVFNSGLAQFGVEGAGQYLDTLGFHHKQWRLKASCLSGIQIPELTYSLC